jgi:hypothetical protein
MITATRKIDAFINLQVLPPCPGPPPTRPLPAVPST